MDSHNRAPARLDSTDEEESHMLVSGSNTDVEKNYERKMEEMEEGNYSTLNKLYIASALLDIAGYVIRTIG